MPNRKVLVKYLEEDADRIYDETYEKIYKDTDKAIEMYNLLLEEFPMSMLAEPVRIRIRQLSGVKKS